jgi:hypothetical protein
VGIGGIIFAAAGAALSLGVSAWADMAEGILHRCKLWNTTSRLKLICSDTAGRINSDHGWIAPPIRPDMIFGKDSGRMRFSEGTLVVGGVPRKPKPEKKKPRRGGTGLLRVPFGGNSDGGNPSS